MHCVAPKTLPKYSDDEVGTFHPYLETALKCAIDELGEADLEVLHHEPIGKIVADLIVRRRSTGRFVLFIEVKRLSGDVSSTRHKLQAQGYVTEALASGAARVERPYYVLTNIEIFEAFKYSPGQPSVDQQILNISPLTSGRFSDNSTTFFLEVVKNCKVLLTTALGDTGEYKPTSQRLDFLLESRKAVPSGWHETLLLTGYEYIRGSLNPSGWGEALRHQKDPSRLLDLGSALDFSGVFAHPAPLASDPDLWNPALLNEIFTNGKIRRTGEDISQSAYNLISEGRSQEGLVPTDLELARLLSSLVRHVFGRELRNGEVICDPAAGTGSLLGAVPYSFVTIQPTQIWGNEREPQMIEPLSLVLGLLFSAVLTPVNAPKVTATDVVDLDPVDFEDVGIILMNPPFRSGITSQVEKARLAERIRAITGDPSKLNLGQSGLESVFLELIYNLVPDGTTFGLVFPEQIATGSGDAAKLLRRFLIEKFGLKVIATYPGDYIFEGVTKGTCLIIGQKNVSSAEVVSVQVSLPLTTIDPDALRWDDILLTQHGNLGYGISYDCLQTSDLEKKIDSGWRFLSSTGLAAESWVADMLQPHCDVLANEFGMRRGRLGNKGASDLIFPDSNATTWNRLEGLIPATWLAPALRTVDEIDQPTASRPQFRTHALKPPAEAFDIGTPSYDILESIISAYVDNFKNNLGGQIKAEKTFDELLAIVEDEAKKSSPAGTIWIPRNIRRRARSFRILTEAYVTTNVLEIFGDDIQKQRLLHSWTLTIFAQLHFEVLAKDQEGARKLEAGPIGSLLIPHFDQIAQDKRLDLLQVYDVTDSFNDLYDPQISDLDIAWAEVLWGNRAATVLNQVIVLLKDMVFERDPH